jgi:hypothetical protein
MWRKPPPPQVMIDDDPAMPAALRGRHDWRQSTTS